MADKKEDKKYDEIDWAQIVDLFAFEYGWTIDEIMELDAAQICLLIKAIRKRRRSGSKSISRGLMGLPSSGNEPNLKDMEKFFRKSGAKIEKTEDGKLNIKL